MRAKEFINEESRRHTSIRKSAKKSIPNLTSYPSLNNNNSPYLAYRFGVALATSPEHNMDPMGPNGSNFQMIDYTDADTEIRKGAEKIMGVKSSESTGKDSSELESTNKTSPIAKIKKNRYGV